MRASTYVILGVIVAFGVAVIFFTKRRQFQELPGAPQLAEPPVQRASSASAEPGVTSTTAPRSGPLKSPSRKQPSQEVNTAAPLPIASTQEAMRAWSNLLQQGLDRYNEDYRWPIAFYGRVLDEKGHPVPQAHVHFSWSEAAQNEPLQRDTASDSNGLFAISGIAGHTLHVSVSSVGYYPTKSSRQSFNYSQKYGEDYHRPDAIQPVLFCLRKRGAGTELVTSTHGVYSELEFSTPRDGSPVRVDFLSRKAGGDGQMEIRCVKPPRGQTGSEWSFRLSIPDGGFVEHDDEFPYEAPASGYQPAIEFHFRAGESNWTDVLRRKYYVAFGQPPKYGRIEIETGMYMGVRLGYAINPDGSRYLEPKEPKIELGPPLVPGAVQIIPQRP